MVDKHPLVSTQIWEFIFGSISSQNLFLFYQGLEHSQCGIPASLNVPNKFFFGTPRDSCRLDRRCCARTECRNFPTIDREMASTSLTALCDMMLSLMTSCIV